MAQDDSHIAKAVAQQLHRLLDSRRDGSEIIAHNLEKGLGNEVALREVLRSFLPSKFKVGKGKVVNGDGATSRHIDIIIYDGMNFPTLFVDENQNQIVPVEGVVAAVEVKTTLASQPLRNAFEQLATVAALTHRVSRSSNQYLDICPPTLTVFAFADARSLTAIARQYDQLSKECTTDNSFIAYSSRSPGFERHTHRKFLVHSVYVMGKGAVGHSFDGRVTKRNFGEYTLGMFLSTLLDGLSMLELPPFEILNYINHIFVKQWQTTGKPMPRGMSKRQSRKRSSRK